uniref:Uncharacterized protein n=1 Tax=Rhizophora mucronata TaxID=61149 RepID=A0A2P2PDV8_RHIMU
MIGLICVVNCSILFGRKESVQQVVGSTKF